MYKINQEDNITSEDLVDATLRDEEIGLCINDALYEYQILQIMENMGLARLLEEENEQTVFTKNGLHKRRYHILFDTDIFQNGNDIVGYEKNEIINVWFDFIHD